MSEVIALALSLHGVRQLAVDDGYTIHRQPMQRHLGQGNVQTADMPSCIAHGVATATAATDAVSLKALCCLDSSTDVQNCTHNNNNTHPVPGLSCEPRR